MSLALQPVVGWPWRALGWLPRRLAAEQGRLALWLPAAMCGGVLLYFQPRAEPPAWIAWAALSPLPLALLLARRWPLAGWAVGLAAAAGLGFAVAAFHAARAPPPLDLPRGAATVTGKVVEVDALPEGLRLTLRAAVWAEGAAPARRDLRVRLQPSDPARPQPGDTVRLRALLRSPSAPAYPGAWDFQRDAFFSGLGGSGFALGPAELLARGGEAPPLSATRAAVEARAMQALPGPAGAVAAALLTGGQSAIPPAEMRAMRDSGLAHLLSVSGLHVAIVMGLTFALARAAIALWPGFVLRHGSKPWAALAALAAGGFYTVLTGAQVPMQRAFAMAALVTLALLTGRRAVGPRVLALAAAAVLVLQPAAILGPSFQMSFAAVMALIAAYEALRPRLAAARLRRGGLSPLARAGVVLGLSVLTSVVAGLATTPFGLHHFGRLQLYGVAANALAVPLTSFVVMPAAMAALALMPLGLEGWPLALMGLGVEGILAVAREVASWPGAATVARPTTGAGLAVTALGLAWLCLWGGGWRLLGVPLIALGLASARLAAPPDALISADGRLLAAQLDGQLWLERRPGASRFTQEAWLRGLGVEEARPLPREGEEEAGGRLRCEPGLCLLLDGEGRPRVALLRPPAPRAARPPRGPAAPPPEAPRPGPNPACGRAPVLLSPEPVRGRCPGSEAVVDRFSVWRDGAHAVWWRDGRPVVLSDRAHRGDRPWVPPRPLPRATSEEPPALAE